MSSDGNRFAGKAFGTGSEKMLLERKDMAANIAPVKELRDRIQCDLRAIDKLDENPALAALPSFSIHIEAIREHLRATAAHILFVIEQYETD
jgi:hypothetical protein